MSTPLPDKQFFKIGEAAEIVGVKSHVLRYWESEFSAIKPLKTRGAHRMYRRADVELLCLIRRLLHEEGYTISGAKKRVAEILAERTQGASASSHVDGRAARELVLRAELLQVRNELEALLAELDRQTARPATPETRAPRATVTAVIPKTVLMQPGRFGSSR
jgi:DNA-binding transcriptional MerR regulator